MPLPLLSTRSVTGFPGTDATAPLPVGRDRRKNHSLFFREYGIAGLFFCAE
jgi:hypothetical protein